jgi:hypothetical protein
MRIWIDTTSLTDRSRVHDVLLADDEGQVVRFRCIDQACARVLADTIYDAVNDFTTDTATLTL